MTRDIEIVINGERRRATACRCTGYQSIVEGVLLAAERGAGQANIATT